MINLEHDKTLIVGARKDAPEWSTFEERTGGAEYEATGTPGRFVVTHLLGIRHIEWTCPCGASGKGFPPETHASGACGATQTASVGWEEWVCQRCGERGIGTFPTRRATNECVGYVDGAGI